MIDKSSPALFCSYWTHYHECTVAGEHCHLVAIDKNTAGNSIMFIIPGHIHSVGVGQALVCLTSQVTSFQYGVIKPHDFMYHSTNNKQNMLHIFCHALLFPITCFHQSLYGPRPHFQLQKLQLLNRRPTRCRRAPQNRCALNR